ncbi:hypothetical protein ACFXPX_12595 [Kitasatospora sp. NPDC059146]|uniref:hypothetical protein n=1 Tax=Kitasatospora sp. NPDC059146 TaxID=3346741 RepID=UPI0036BB3EED
MTLVRQGDAPAVSELRVLEVYQTSRFEEALGQDVRIIDNHSGPAPVTRTFKASREWTRTLSVAEQGRRAATGEAGVNLLWLSTKTGIEQELQRNLSLAIGATHLFEEEITVTVPERTAVQVVLAWKRIWQQGHARIVLPDGSNHDVPYQVVVSVTFDQRIETTNPQAGP